MAEIECLVTLSADDFTLDGHRVGGVPVLPAAALLDLVARVLHASGTERVELRDVTFAVPLTVPDRQDREIRCTVHPAGAVRVASRAPGGPWQEHVTAELADCVAAAPVVPIGELIASASHTEDLAAYYERASAAGVSHSAAMRCAGTVHHSATSTVAELRLEAAVHEKRFRLHPAKLDAATVVAFGAAAQGTHVLVHIREFRSVAPLHGACFVQVPAPAVVSGDVATADFIVCDADGRFLAGCRGVAWKRLREPTAGAGAPAWIARGLRDLVATQLDKPADAVDTNAGFYDLGLDSLALLKLVGKVEDLVGRPLYPTLLFEYSTVDSLAAHLSSVYPLAEPAAPPQPARQAPGGVAVETPPEVAVTSYWTSHWVEEPAPQRAPARLAVTGPDWLVAALDNRVTIDRSAGDAVLYLPHDTDLAEACHTMFALASAHSRLTVVCPGRTPQAEALAAAARTVMAEAPQKRCRVITVPEAADPDGCAELVLAGVRDDSVESEVDLTSGRRRIRRWKAATAPGPVPLRQGGSYVVTGGSGGLARLLTDHLVSRYHARVLLVGRRPPRDDALARWRTAGGEVRYVQADVTDARAAARAVQVARDAFGQIHGVIHAAGIRRDGVYVTKTRDDIASVLAPKVLGAAHLDAATAGDRLDFFVVYSSLSARVANPGQSDYAAANACLEAFVEHRRGAGRGVAIGWPYWAGGGMRVDTDLTVRSGAEHGLIPLPAADGIAAFERVLSGPDSAVTVLHGRPGVEALLPAAEVAQPAADDGVAIIGVAGRYPQAPDIDAFWRVLRDGVDCVTEVPPDRWDHAAYYDPAKGTPRRTYGRWGGFLDGADCFDPAFFGISRREAERMDPQERLFLSTCWHTLEDAGYPPDSLREDTVGVFAGVMWNHYQLVEGAVDGVAPYALHTAVPNRVSYSFDLSGPSIAVDTACSSSLTAVHLAVASLRRGECDLALAGGVNVIAHPQKYLQLAQGNWLSTDGRCRAFGKDGSGYVPGEGVGAVLLKPLARARRDGDFVYGVIRGSAINHSGRTSGVTVPSPGSQAKLIGAALRDAGWDPSTVGYVEAHGTGTSLGDPIEIEGMTRAFGTAGSCAVGSVKSNIGHLESAAGIAGLTKVLLQLRHRRIAPSLHAEEPNPHIDFAATPFTVPTRPMKWEPRDGAPLRAGVSGFGAGGANAHLLVEEAPERAASGGGAGPWLCVLSGRDPGALAESARRLATHVRGMGGDAMPQLVAWLEQRLGVPAAHIDGGSTLGGLGLDGGDLAAFGRGVSLDGLGPDSTLSEVAACCDAACDLTDLAYTLQVGRAHLQCRLAVVAGSGGQLARSLDRYVAGDQPGHGEFWGTDPHRGGDPGVERSAFARLAEVAAAWVAGSDVDWRSWYLGARRPCRIPLPGYPFREERFWPGRWAPDGRTGQPPATLVTDAGRAPDAGNGQDAGRAPDAGNDEAGADVELRLLEGGIGLVTMRAPTFTEPLIDRLAAAFDQIARDDGVRVVVVTGRESMFSMGGSAETLAEIASGNARFTDRPFLYEGLLRCDRPVICAMRGHAAGGGMTFGLYADIVVMSRDGEYRANFTSYGFTPGLGATYILERRFGPALAAELLLTGRAMRGAELADRGANVTFVPGDRVLPTALELARSIAAKPPAAIRALKTELAGRLLAGLPQVVAREAAMHEQVLDTQTQRLIEEHFPVPRAAVPPAPAQQLPDLSDVRAAVEDIVGGVLYLRRDEIDPRLTFADMGLDSVGAVEIVGQLNRRFVIDLDSTMIYDRPTVSALTQAVAADIARAAALRQAALAPATAPEPVVVEREAGPPSEPVPVGQPAPLPALDGPGDDENDTAPVDGTGQVRLAPLDDDPAAAGEYEAAGIDEPDPAPEDGGDRFAVIGMSGAFPDAPDLAGFWRNLADGRCSIREVPPDRWDIGPHYNRDRRVPDCTYSKWAAMLPDVASFDAPFFNLSPLDAQTMDPQQRLFLQHAWAALEDAGYATDEATSRPWGVFAGCAAGDYADLLAAAGENGSSHAFLGNTPSVLVARIAYLLNLTGPAIAVDTACSSSLVALDMACASLARGECDLAVAGGVAVMCTPKMHIWTSKTGMLSATGQCRPFDAAADGIVLGEGVGAVVLKKLERALADGDHIHGVILASGVNSDGTTNGITAPSADAQAALIKRVHGRAGVRPEDIGYVEAHGTGTQLGDPIEVRGLAEAFGKAGTVRFGSVKGNIGHTTMAAGIAGVLKVLLALRHGLIPPSIGYERANPHTDLARGPLQVVTELTPWRPGPDGRRIGAVSSFGFSGVNCHVVVAEAPKPRPRGEFAAGAELVALSAKDDNGLRRRARELAGALNDQPLADVAYTLAVGRRHLKVRAAHLAKDLADLRAWLSDLAEGTASSTTGHPPAAAYLRGENPDWSDLYAGRPVRRVPLPTYPFAGDRHWVAGPDNELTELRLEPGHWLVRDHLIGGVPMLPATASIRVLAMVGMAEGLAAPLRLRNLRWPRPVAVTGPRTVRIAATATSDGFAVTLTGESGEHAHGTVTATGLAGEKLDLDTLRRTCVRSAPVDEIYRRFAAGGVEYRGAHRALQSVQWGDDLALGTLHGRQDALAPPVLDAALQAAVVLAGDGGDGPLLPFAVQRVDVLDPRATPRFTVVRRQKDNLFSVQVADDTGRVCVRMEGMHLRSAPGAAPGEQTVFVPQWRPAPALAAPPAPARVAVVAEPGDQLGLELLRAGGPEQATMVPPDQVESLVCEPPPDMIYLVRPPPIRLFRLVKAMHEAGWSRQPVALTVVLRDDADPVTASSAGLVGAIRAEYPRWRAGCVAAEPGPRMADRIAREDLAERQVALRGTERLVRRFAPAPRTQAAAAFRREGSYLILGGAGGLGRAFSRYLARTYHARLSWIGRRPEDGDIRAARAEIERLGGQAAYFQADATDAVALAAAVAQARSRFGPPHGAIHAAMVLRDRSLAAMTEADLAEVLAPKVEGAVAFAEAVTQSDPLDWLAIFSSAVSCTDAAGQGNYATASCFEDAYAQVLQARGVPATVINWGFWGSVGAVATPGHRERFAALGISPLEPQDGVSALEQVLAMRIPQALVVKGTPAGLAALGVETLAGAVDDYAALDDYCRHLLAARFAGFAGVPGPGQRVSVTELAERLSVVPGQRRLFEAVLGVLVRAGAVRQDGEQVEILAAPAPEVALRHPPHLAGHVRLLDTCLRALPAVLAGARRGVEVLFPHGSMALLDGVYAGNTAADFHHELVAGEVASAARQVPGRPAEILEIGAGTGASTGFILRAGDRLPERPRLHFTDVSPLFLTRARERFDPDQVTFGVFDVERDPAEQGLTVAGYDIVVAANVLHATADIATTLSRVESLLRPGGRLVINETVRVSDFLTLTFGLTEGWWRFQDPAARLSGAPLLSARQWRTALAAGGLSTRAVHGIPGVAEENLHQCVLVAEKPDRQASPKAAREYVRRVFAEVLRFRDADLDERATFDTFGVDSLVSLAIIDRLARDLGDLPATLLFAHTTIESLAAHLARTRPVELSAVTGAAPSRPPAVQPVEPPAPSPTGDIAIIGVTGRYPGSPDVNEFWRNLAAGRHCVGEVPPERFDWRAHVDPRQGSTRHSYGRWGGFIDGVDQFDPEFFGILPRDAAVMDPQERLFLQTAWTLLQDTGYLAGNTREPSTGVFVATMYGAYGQIAAANGWPDNRYSDGHSPYWSIANRVSYTLDLHGPSFAVDSACSSSLTAIHLAAQSLIRGECRMAIAGGVNLILHPAHLAALSSMRMLAADGACKVFDERADGFAPGEGVGAVLLKPLAAALADGDEIWAVIKGSHVNAGGRTAGYTVPNPNAQADLIAEAIRRSGVDPATIGYVEAHGTGTSLGDPIELSALAQALAAVGGPRRVAVGSVKANIGHLEGAAGIAGLTKVLLQMRAGQIAPCVNLDRVNPRIDLESTPFVLPRTLTEWTADGPRRAGVSSFGAGGANAHVVLEEHPRRGAPAAPAAEHAFLLSAQTRAQLRAMAADLAAAVDPATALDALAYSSQVGRAELPERLAVLATDADELVARLRAATSDPEPEPAQRRPGEGQPGEGIERGTAKTRVVDDPTGIDHLYSDRRLRALARLWVSGTPVDWRRLWPVPPARVTLPPHRFDLKRYWLPEYRRGYRFARPSWRREELVPGEPWSPRTVLVLGARHLTGPEFVQVPGGCGPEDLARLVEDLAGEDRLPEAIIHVPSGDDPCGPLLWAARAVLTAAGPAGLRVVTGFDHRDSEPGRRALPALLRSIALEHSRFAAVSVAADSVDGALLPELRALTLDGEPEARVQSVRYADGARWTSTLDDIDVPVSPGAPVVVRAGGTYVITGGGGALGRVVAGYLSRQARVTVVLVSRTPVDAADLGPGVVHYPADLASRHATRELFARIRREHGPVNGLVHAAGITRDALLVRKAPADVAAVLAAKVDTALNVDAATVDDPLDFFVLFSSVAAHTGNLGQTDYAYANAYLNELAVHRNDLVGEGTRRGRTISISWPLWADGGMTVGSATRGLLARRFHSTPLSTADGLAAFADALRCGETNIVVSTVPAPTGQPSVPADPPAARPSPVAATEQEMRATVESDLCEIAAKFLLVEPADIDLAADLIDTGFDSISLTELINAVNERYDLDLLPTVLFESVNLAAFARLLVTEHGTAVAARSAATPATRTEAPSSGPAARTAPPMSAEPPARTESPRTVQQPAPPVQQPAPAVAVIGMAGTFPGSAGLGEFWQHLIAGKDLTGPVPADRADLLADSRTAGIRAGFMADVRSFDAGLFGIAPREAALMDPQQRLFLQTVWRAIEDAGYAPSAFAGTATGLFAGVSACDYDDLLRTHQVPIQAHTASGIASCILANRVSHLLDMRGPSEAIDTACSSSLVAVHRAVRAIQAGECDAALAGGVNVLLSPGLFVAFADSGMLSPDGRCKSFDATADGYGRGEGVGVVLLKPLERAVADGDHVYAVIRGSAVNHGGHAASLTAPNPQAQGRVIANAYRDAGVDPATVGYIETHGTGTSLGDPIEIEGLKKGFAELGAVTSGQPWVGLGTVKANIGHLEAAAGIAGLLKVLLCLRHGQLPPTINLTAPNPLLTLAGTPFFLVRQARNWGPLEPRRAGVSSFGFGGTNAHVVVESYPTDDRGPRPDGPHTVVLSAPTREALRRYADDLADFLAARPETFARLAYTTQVGRQALRHRLAFRAGSATEAVDLLRSGGGMRGVAGPRRVPEAPVDPVEAWVAGYPVDWSAQWPAGMRRLPGMPSFPFATTAHWFPERHNDNGREVTVQDSGAKAAHFKLRLSNVSGVRPAPPAVEIPPAASPQPAVETPPAAGASPAASPAGGRRPVAGTPRPPLAASTAGAPPGSGDIADAIRGQLAVILGARAEDLNTASTFADVGLDSIFRMELVRWLNATFDVQLRAADLYEYDSIEALAGAVDRPRAGTGSVRDRLTGLIERTVRRPIDPALTFTDNGFTSFDMLRLINELDKRFGPQRKTLLFDRPTVHDVAEELTDRYGPTTLEKLAAGARTDATSRTPKVAADGPVAVLKRELHQHPELADAIARLERDHGMEGGLAGRDIAPFALVGTARDGYFNVSIDRGVLFAWSYVGPGDKFHELAGELVTYSRNNGLKPNFLSLQRVQEIQGEPFTTTPFGALQRLDNIGEFSLAGGQMSRLRYMVRRFERLGQCRTVEYRSGTDAGTDAAVATMLDRWTANKQMVNPYVAVVRDEVKDGRLTDRHRLFLTYADDELANAIIITKIPSVPGYLLDLEFYPPEAPLGGLEFAMVRIIETVAAEGCTTFSLGASFGVKLDDVPNADPGIERELEELRSIGVFGEGNFQFKNKFRPVNQPIYLCQPAGGDSTPVSEIILMIANPQLRTPEAPPEGGPEPVTDPATTDPAVIDPAAGALATGDPVAIDMITDSWAELDSDVIRARTAELTAIARDEEVTAAWLPMRHRILVGSGRSAESLLCTNWPGRRGAVPHNGLFPTLTAALVTSGFTPVPVGRAGDGDLALDALADLLGQLDVAFVAVELSPNVTGGRPVSLENLRSVRTLAERHGVPVVLDATRIVDNAVFIADGRPVWEVVHELLSMADAATFSLTKDFGVTSGGLLAVDNDELNDAIVASQLATGGRDLSLVGRRIAAAALSDTQRVEALVRRRVAMVRTLWTKLRDAGAPVVGEPGGHCVLVAGQDPARLLAEAGIRTARHLGDTDELRHCVRLAVPVGLSTTHATDAGQRLAKILGDAGESVAGGENFAVLREHCPSVRRRLLRIGDLPARDTEEREPAATRPALGGFAEIEVFTAGDGPPVLFLPPFNVGAGFFAPQFARMAQERRVICVHHPGVGASTGAADITLGGLARLTRAALEQLGVTGKVHVAGASFGGLTALAYVLAYPEDCASLTLIGSSYRIGNRVGQLDRLEVVVREDFDHVLTAPGTGRLAMRRADIERTLLRCESMDPQTGLRYLDVFAARPNLRDRLADVAVPTLIVQGSHDTVIPSKTAHLLHGAIPDARYVELPGAGHFPGLTHPNEVNDLLLGLTAGQAAVPAVAGEAP